jgi:hypothetical protein
MYTQEELNKLTEKELLTIAADMGLTINADSTSKKALAQAIISAQDAVAIVPVEPDSPDLSDDITLTPAKPEEKLRLIVANQEGPEATAFVKVCVNGNMFAIPRDKEVIVPSSVVEVLRNAIVTRLVQENGQTIERSAPRFSFTVLGAAR